MNFENSKNVRVGAVVLALTALISVSGCDDKKIEATDKNTVTQNFSASDSVVKTENPTPTQNPTVTEAPITNPTATEAPIITPEPTAVWTLSPEVTASPAPTDSLRIPEGLSQEDYNVRLAVKGAFEYTNPATKETNLFALNANEVKQYITSGETTNFNTFELMKDANGKPAFVVIKGGDNGYTPDQMTVIKRTLTKMNQIDSGVVRSMADYGLRVLAYDINNEGIFDKNSGYGGTYRNYDFGGVVFTNTIYMYVDKPSTDFCTMSALFCESRALYTTRYSTDGTWYTNAPDRLNDKIGLDKAYLGIQWTNNLFTQGKINQDEKEDFQANCNSAIAYYTNNP